MLRNAIIHGGTFVHTSASPISDGFKILHDNIATGAFHDSGERFDPPKCHPNTRLAVLAEIMHWIQAIEISETVLWLYGSAGAGKSAIAQTIAEMCAELGLLVTSFFFSRSSQLRNNERRLIPSIAYQLALSIPGTRSYIEAAVQIDPSIFDRSLETQIETLIIRPLKNAYTVVNPAEAKQWPKLIIIDGLDECHGPSIQCSIIRLVSSALLRIPVPFILLVASRPEPHIRTAFNLLIKSHASRHIVLDDSYNPDADIKEYLLSRFNEIKTHHQLAAYIPESWPSADIINQLVRKSSGQFIYASTVMKYLDSPDHRPMKRLDIIIGLKSADGDMPYGELDALYSYIFSCVNDLPTTLRILGFLFFKSWFWGIGATPDFLALLLGLDKEDIHLCLSKLHSILSIPPSNTSGTGIQPTHASLQDFLVDKLRSRQYYLDEEAFHTNLAQRCVRQISALANNHASISAFSKSDTWEYWEVVSKMVEVYLLRSFILHCTQASTDCSDLKNDLLQICDLRPWFGFAPGHPPNTHRDLPSLFAWLYKAETGSKELSSYIRSLCDQYLTITLNEHTSNARNIDIAIAGLLFFPSPWDSHWFSLVSGISQIPDIFTWEPDEQTEPYQCFLGEFFEDKDRSGKYYLDGIVYARAALECFRNMVNPNDDEVFNPYPFILGIERPDAQLFFSISEDIVASQREILVRYYREGLDAVIRLLSKAAPLADLYLYLRDHPLQNPAKAKVHCEHGFASLRLAVKVYLDKCTHDLQVVPRVLRRRSASRSLCFPYVDLELHSGTFNERWPLAKDRLSKRWKGFLAKKVEESQVEIMALRSRTHVSAEKEFDST